LSSDVRDEIIALLVQGQKIKAIEPYREATGADLKDALHVVNSIAARNGLD